MRYIKPILHIIPWELGLGITMNMIVLNLYNPTKWDTWCSIAADQNRKKDEIGFHLVASITQCLCITFIDIILTCFLLILCLVIQIDRIVQGSVGHILHYSPSLTDNKNKASYLLENNKVVVKQVVAYFLSFATTLGVLLVRSVIEESPCVFYLSFALTPLQGLFNAIIFIKHKVYSYCSVHDNLSRFEVIGLL